MPTVKLSPVGGAGDQFLDNNGNPLSGGKLYFYDAGTTTPRATYTSIQGDVANANPVVLGVDGRSATDIWLEYGYAYKAVLKTSADVQLDSWDNVTGIERGPEGNSPITETLEAYTYNADAVQIDVDDSDGFAVGSYCVITDGTNRTTGILTAKATASVTFQPLASLPPGDAGGGTVYAIGSTFAVCGAQGATGEEVIWLAAAGAPGAGTGEDGDMYLNTSNGDVYGPKASGAWGSAVCNIRIDWLTGAGVPGAGTGDDGDMYLNISNGDVYGPKAAGAWGAAVGNIQGPAANLSDDTPASPTVAGTSGVSSLASRADHAHPSGLQSLGDILYGGVAGVISRLTPNTSVTPKVLTMTGDGAAGAAPVWADRIAPVTNAARAYQSSAQSTGAGTYSKLQLQTENYDLGGEFDTSTYRYTAELDGIVNVSCAFRVPSPGVGAYGIAVYKNGSVYAWMNFPNHHTNTTSLILGGACQVKVVATDYLEIYIYTQPASTIGTGSENTYADFTLMPT